MTSEQRESRIDDLPTRYRRKVISAFDDAPAASVTASVILVTYHTDRADFESVVTALDEQTVDDFEVLVINNGNDWSVESLVQQFDRVTAYAELDTNQGVTFGRNLGAHLASSDLLVFLDDDGVPDPDFVRAHQRAHSGDVLGVRGRVLTMSDSIYNRGQSWYDLGEEPVPYYLNTEGNSSYDRDAFCSVGGFNEELEGRAGHEGNELTYRLIEEGGYDREQFIYHPDPVIYHDVASGLRSYLRKEVQKRRNQRRIADWHPGLHSFLQGYEKPEGTQPQLQPHEVLVLGFLERITRLICVVNGLQQSVGSVTRRVADRFG